MLASVVDGANLAPAKSLKKIETKKRNSIMTRWMAMQARAPEENGWNLSCTRVLLCDGKSQRL